MDAQQAVGFIDRLLDREQQRKLNDLESTIVLQVWEGNTYQAIGDRLSYETDYIKQVAARLWKLLSKILGENICKGNIRSALERCQSSIAIGGASLFLGNLALLPLAPLCQTDTPRDLLSQVAIEVAKIENRQDRQITAGYTEILAGVRLEKGLIRQLLSEDIMQESVIYQDILQKGEQKEALKYTLRLLNRRFGEINESVVDRIKVLSTEQLEVLGEEFFDFTDVPALFAWLDRSTGS